MAHSNISVFVPHIGCPCKCSFCNQFSITEQIFIPHEKDVDKAVEIALSSQKYDPENGEIAFFGGSFTAINRDYMTELLSAAKKHIDMIEELEEEYREVAFINRADISKIDLNNPPGAPKADRRYKTTKPKK